MGETTQQIKAHISDTREDLGANLQELEQKVKAAADWKHHFQTKPMTMLGVAFGGGILLATMMGGRNRRTGPRRFVNHAAGSAGEVTGRIDHGASRAWDNIKGALMGVAATRLTQFVDEVVPGFQDQYKRTSEKTRQTNLS